ncbi:MAG TPA: serine/threonine-protein kinase [Gemmataceae bacterium]|jgi:serine/threonine-protein kinase|nr:serine/threonine-protein kinase [Gemmataceae bacterium]
MIACNEAVFDFLHSHARFSRTQVERLQQWWLANRRESEELHAFLARQQLVSSPTARILQLVAQSNMTEVMAHALIEHEELTELRLRLPELVVLPEEDKLSATVTLLAGGDTDKETTGSHADLPLIEHPRVGMRLGKYVLTEWIGEGSCGIVFRAFHPTLQIPVAVKVLHPAKAIKNRELHGKLKAEGQLLARLNHRYVVRVFDFEPDGDFPFLVLEYVSGPNLAELIEQSGRIQPSRALRILRQLADALGAAHAMGIVHRDIKPANVLLTRSGVTKLADLGLALVQQPFLQSQAGTPPFPARAGTIFYIAPELAEGGVASEQSDMYSLGATIYHALTGSPPFVGSTAREIRSQHSSAPVPSPKTRVPDLPDDLAQLVLQMLAKDPRQRPASFAALLHEPMLFNSQ